MHLRLLGTVEAEINGRELDMGPRLRQLTLAVLLLEVTRPVTVDRLISLLWDGEPPATARNSVQGHVSRLRRLFSGVPDVELRTQGDTYVMEADPLRIDAHRFQALAEQARGACDERAAALLREGLDLWRGEILAGIATDRVRRQLCAPWEEARVAAYERCIDAELRLGRHEQVIGELTSLVSDHPTRERFTAMLMIALHRSGCQGDAIDAYHRTKSILVEEYGLEPSAELQGLAMAVLRAEPGLAVPHTPLRAPVVVPRQLPADTVFFTAREDALARLDLLRGRVLGDGSPGRTGTGAVRKGSAAAHPAPAPAQAQAQAQAPGYYTLAVISGTAGVGKTALAVHWAHQVRHLFPDGQLYVDLRGWSPLTPLPAADVLAQFLRALGVPASEVPAAVDEQAAFYRSVLADRRVLVVLDNAHSAAQVRPLLPGATSCAVVVTSRRSLDDLVTFQDALPVELGLLDEDDAVELLARVIGADRVRQEPAAAADLTRLCAGLPLALRIAAGRLASRPAYTLHRLAAELDGGAPLSALTPLGEPAAALRAAFRFSYTSLPPSARPGFRRLGLVPGPDLPLEGAAALWDVPPEHAAVTLDTLVSAHLVQEPTPGRFRLHSLLREYARERVDAEEGRHERQAALFHLLRWYLRHADAAVRALFPGFLRLPTPAGCPEPDGSLFAKEADARAWLEAEAPAMVAAIQHASIHGPLAVGWQLADALRGFFWLHGRYADWLTAAEAGLRAARAAGDERAQAVMHHSLGHACRQLSRHDEAITHLTKALRTHQRFAWREGEAITLGNLGMVHTQQGDTALAIDHHLRAIAIHRETGARASEAIALNNLADAYRAQGDLDAALNRHLASLALSRAACCRQSEVQAAIGLAATHLTQGRLPEAFARVHDAVAAARTAGYLPLEGQALTVLGQAYQATGAPEEARLHWQHALEIFTMLNSPESRELRCYLELPEPADPA